MATRRRRGSCRRSPQPFLFVHPLLVVVAVVVVKNHHPVPIPNWRYLQRLVVSPVLRRQHSRHIVRSDPPKHFLRPPPPRGRLRFRQHRRRASFVLLQSALLLPSLKTFPAARRARQVAKAPETFLFTLKTTPALLLSWKRRRRLTTSRRGFLLHLVDAVRFRERVRRALQRQRRRSSFSAMMIKIPPITLLLSTKSTAMMMMKSIVVILQISSIVISFTFLLLFSLVHHHHHHHPEPIVVFRKQLLRVMPSR